MAVAVLLVYIVMVLVFNSLVDPLVIMFSLPLATIGAFPALFLTQRPIGISALIGFLMLIGIVVTNAIVLLDLVEQHRHKGMPMYDALIQGGRTRVRPILMTAIATILALVPLAWPIRGRNHRLGAGHGRDRRLFTSTFLTLIVIPVVYSLVEDAKVRTSRAFGRGQKPRHRSDGRGGGLDLAGSGTPRSSEKGRAFGPGLLIRATYEDGATTVAGDSASSPSGINK